MDGLVLGIDIGTQSAKAVLAELDGRILARARRPHEVARPAPGRVEQEGEVWWQEVVSLARELLDGVPVGELAAVCVSGMGPCVLLADAAGEPLRPAILYGVDSRAGAEIAELERMLGVEELLARCGSPLTSQAAGPKLLWLARHEAEIVARARFFLMPSSLAVLRLTGEYVLDHASASQCDPLYDIARRTWIEEWAEAVCGQLPLPRLLWPDEVAGQVTAAAASETGIPAGTPVCAGTIDAWAEAVSVGVEEPGQLMLMYGTTLFLLAPTRQARPTPRLWLTVGTRRDTWALAAGTATSGALVSWLDRLAGGPGAEALLAEAARVAPGAEGLLALPYFAGERTPLFDPDARGALLGLTLEHGRAALARAMLEATAFAVRHNLEALSEAGVEPHEAVAVGGGASGRLWPQLVSEVTGLVQRLPRETIGAAYGDARLAARAVGAQAEWSLDGVTLEPTRSSAGLYDELYGLYRELYEATREHTHALARLQRQTASELASRDARTLIATTQGGRR